VEGHKRKLIPFWYFKSFGESQAIHPEWNEWFNFLYKQHRGDSLDLHGVLFLRLIGKQRGQTQTENDHDG
jgi:hypothetical protein